MLTKYLLLFLSHSVMIYSLQPHGRQHTGFPVLHHLSKLAQFHVHWVGDIIQPSHPLLSHPLLTLSLSKTQGFFPVSWLFTSDGQSIRNSASASVLSMSMKGWIPLELTGSISLLSKGLSRVFSSTTIQRHQFFGTQPSLWSNLQIHTWLRDAIFSLS